MIERDGDAIHVSCDSCPEHHTAFTDDWSDAVAEVKDAGWKMKRDGGEGWTHTCPACLEDEQAADVEAEARDGGGMPDETW